MLKKDFFLKQIENRYALLRKTLWGANLMSCLAIAILPRLMASAFASFEINEVILILTTLNGTLLALLGIAPGIIGLLVHSPFKNSETNSNGHMNFLESKKSRRTKHGQSIWSQSDLDIISSFEPQDVRKWISEENGFKFFLMQTVLFQFSTVFGFALALIYKNGSFTIPFSVASLFFLVWKNPFGMKVTH